MAAILLILGILTCGAGIAAIGIGVPINEFNLGSTLIISGTTALAAGLVLIGLAAVAMELARLAAATREERGVSMMPPRTAAEFATSPLGTRAVPPMSPVATLPESPVPAGLGPRGVESHPAPDAIDVSASAIERLRSSIPRSERKGENGADTSEVPLPPGTAQAPAESDAAPEPDGDAETGAPPAAPQKPEIIKQPRLDFLFRPRPAQPQPPQPQPFDTMWPKRPDRPQDAGALAEQPPSAAGTSPPGSAPVPAPAAAGPAQVRPAAILKSGVVDGMAYTLYADGSIEAQLPHGTVRFGSITELRAHIENNS
jgi:hypothetical protein